MKTALRIDAITIPNSDYEQTLRIAFVPEDLYPEYEDGTLDFIEKDLRLPHQIIEGRVWTSVGIVLDDGAPIRTDVFKPFQSTSKKRR